MRHERVAPGKIECNACPVLCQISAGKSGACDRYANEGGQLVRLDPLIVLRRQGGDGPALPFDGNDATGEGFVTGVGASTTYPDYKPAPFIVSSQVDGVDLVTVVTEGIFSYCSLKLKIDTDRWLGPEQSNVRCRGEVIGHVTTAEYGSQMLSIGGVHHLTGGSKKEGRVTCEAMERLGNQQPLELAIDGGAQLIVQAGMAPIVDGVKERRMRVGCGSATIGIFARQFSECADEVVVVDDHITGVLTEHQAGCCLSMRPAGLRVRGRRSTPGRYFQVANPGTGWGGTDIADPLSILEPADPALAWPGLRLLMVSTTGEHAAWYVLDQNLLPQPAAMPGAARDVVARIGENCEPSLTTVLFVGGAGGSLRAGVTDNPVRLTQAIKQSLVKITCGGAPAYVWPGGGITLMVDVAQMPARSFGSVPTPAIVAPVEFTLRLSDYIGLGGHAGHVLPLADVLARGGWHPDGAPRLRRWLQALPGNPWPLDLTP
jgi:hypothetical protein